MGFITGVIKGILTILTQFAGILAAISLVVLFWIALDKAAMRVDKYIKSRNERKIKKAEAKVEKAKEHLKVVKKTIEESSEKDSTSDPKIVNAT